MKAVRETDIRKTPSPTTRDELKKTEKKHFGKVSQGYAAAVESITCLRQQTSNAGK